MKKIVIIIALILFCAAVIAQAIIATAVRKLAVSELNKIVNTKAEISGLGINLLGGVVSFSGLNIQNPPDCAERYFLKIKQGHIKVRLAALLRRQIKVPQVFLSEPIVNIEIGRGGISNTSRIFKKRPASASGPAMDSSGAKKTTLEIDNIAIRNASFKFVNYKVNSRGATAAFDKINISVEDLTPRRDVKRLPTSLRCGARLASGDLKGNLEFSATGSFLSKEIDFDMDLKAADISLAYFMPFFITTSPVFAESGSFDLRSTARCRDSQLNATQQVNISDLELGVNDANLGDNMVFGLPVINVVNFFINSKGSLDFTFEITGTLADPKFHLAEALKAVLAKSIQEAIIAKLSQLPGAVIDKVKETGDIKDAGKKALKDIFQQIVGPSGSEGKDDKQ